jgi:DNA-binding transcriptional LysR family regulator
MIIGTSTMSIAMIQRMVQMDTEKMSSVLAVARTRSFSEAAVEISLSQSSVTKHVLSVEKELGITIFSRAKTSRSVNLTNEGMIFVKYAQEILELYQKMSDQLIHHSHSVKASMTIYMMPMPGVFNRSSILSSFYCDHPDIQLKTTAKNTAELLPALLNKEIDAAVYRPLFSRDAVLQPDAWLYDPRLDAFEICGNPALVAVSEKHRLADHSGLTIKDLRNETFLVQRPVTPGSSPRYDLFVRSCLDEGFDPKILPNIDQHSQLQGETILSLVAKGVGVMLINAKMPSHLPGLRLIPLLGLTWEAKTAVAAVKGHRPKLVDQLVSCLRQMAGDHP